MKNKVIIIGNDHVNTLGVIRTFGENGIRPYLIIISNTARVAVTKSKYIEEYWICKDEKEAILTMCAVFSKEEKEPIVIPTSDSVTMYIDKNYDNLSNCFVLPNIDNKSNMITEYMDKYNQYKLAKKNNVKVANTTIIKLNDNEVLKCPCVLKPIVSANGKKDDIRICKNKEELFSAREGLLNLGYKEVLYQEFISYLHELDISGFSYNGEISIPGYIFKERIWPIDRGSTTYGIVNNPDKIKKIVNGIKKIMMDLNYNGIFDIDVFVFNEDIENEDLYLNEINFRNSAISYAYGTSYIAYYWYLSNINNMLCCAPIIKKSYHFMDDQADLHNVFENRISYKRHLLERKKSHILLEYNKEDLKSSNYMKKNKIFNKFKINKILNIIDKIYHLDNSGGIYKVDYASLKMNRINNDYDIIEITTNNLDRIFDSDNDIREIHHLLKNENVKGVILTKNGKIIGRGFIKSKGAEDRYFKITDINSFVISHLFVNEEYRGNNYQIDLIRELIDKYTNRNPVLYSFIYDYNIPSIKNFEKIGFIKIEGIIIKRFLKKSVNKYII